MIQLPTETWVYKDIPIHVVRPLRREDKVVVFYHGWGSSGEGQVGRAVWLAAYGYTVFVPDAIHHGGREPLDSYYDLKAYDLFWETVFRNGEEFPVLLEAVRKDGFDRPYLMGHSMGGLSVQGIGATYPKHVKGIVSFNGSGDWELTHLLMQARFGVIVPRDRAFQDQLKRKTPLAHAEAMKDLPMLLTNGESDESLDPRAQKNFFHTLKQCNSKSRHSIYPGLGHFVTTHMMEEAAAFLEGIEVQS